MKATAPTVPGDRLRRHLRRAVVWFGLYDCEGVCDICKRHRALVVEHKPTKFWLCRECFHDQWANQV